VLRLTAQRIRNSRIPIRQQSQLLRGRWIYPRASDGLRFAVQEMAAIAEHFAVARSGQNLLKKSLKSFNKNFMTFFKTIPTNF